MLCSSWTLQRKRDGSEDASMNAAVERGKQ